MKSKIIIGALILFILSIILASCYTTLGVSSNEPKRFEAVAKLAYLNNGESIEFYDGGLLITNAMFDEALNQRDSISAYNYFLKSQTPIYKNKSSFKDTLQQSYNDLILIGSDYKGRLHRIAIQDINYMVFKKLDVGKIVASVVGWALGVVIVYGAVSVILFLGSSCPLIDSYDGQNFIFDAEPLGGAICRGMQRTDLALLEHIKKVDDKFILRMSNQEDETQYIDEVELILVEHPEHTLAVHDLFNNIHIIQNPQSPLSVTDEYGTELKERFASKDKYIWHSSIYRDEQIFNDTTRHNIVFKFAKPENQNKLGFTFSATSTIWSSYMVKEILKMRGNQLNDWYSSMNNFGPDLMQLHNFNQREEHYFMKFYVKEKGEWIVKGYIPSSAPLNNDLRISWFNFEDNASDTLEIMINPPKLFWSFDYVGLAVPSDYTTKTLNLKPNEVTFNNAEYTLQKTSSIDYNYLVLEEPDDNAVLTFTHTDSNFKPKSVFLKITGYYDIHLTPYSGDESPMIKRFVNEHDLILKYSMDLYRNPKDKAQD